MRSNHTKLFPATNLKTPIFLNHELNLLYFCVCFQENVDVWLDAIGLPKYKNNFKGSNIVTRQNMEVLKAMTPEEIAHELEISKPGKR